MSNIISLALLEVTILCTQQLIKESSLVVGLFLAMVLGMAIVLLVVMRKDKKL